MKTAMTRGIWKWLLCLVPSVVTILIYAVVAWQTPPVHLDTTNAAGAVTDFDAQAGRGLPLALNAFGFLCLIVGFIQGRGSFPWGYIINAGCWVFGLFASNILILTMAWIANAVLARP